VGSDQKAAAGGIGYLSNLVSLGPAVKGIPNEIFEFVGDVSVNLPLGCCFALETTESKEERGAIVCTETSS
jgi:hypothetical protein